MARHPRSRAAAALLTVVLLTACGAPDEAPDDPTDDPTSTPDLEDDAPVDDPGADEPGVEEPATGDQEFDAAVSAAVADARETFGAAPEDIEVVEAEPVTWPDGALGCPEPDMSYTQALVDGYRILLMVDGEQVAYHAQREGVPFRCDDPQEPIDG